MKRTIILFMLMIASVMAESIQPMACDPFAPSAEFEEGADICFYGTGFDEPVDLALRDKATEEEVGTIIDADVDNGVLSTVFSGRFFENVKAGIYRLFINLRDRDLEYSEDIVVRGQMADDDDDDDDDPTDPSVPEFGTIAAGLGLIGAGAYAARRRRI